jgi:hypothetical protein
MFDLDLLDRLDTGLAEIAPTAGRAAVTVCTRFSNAPVEDVVRCPEMLARGVCPAAHGPDRVPA